MERDGTIIGTTSMPGRGVRLSSGLGPARPCPPGLGPLVGVLPGEGIGPEIVEHALAVARAALSHDNIPLRVEYGSDIGRVAERSCGTALPDAVIDFSQRIFDNGGTLLSGAGGGRYVYDLRARFDLFCKISPVQPVPQLARARRLLHTHAADTDIIVVREGASGLYQGQWDTDADPRHGRVAWHRFAYTEPDVTRITRIAARMAARRRGRLAIIYKESGAPTISELWRECGLLAARDAGVTDTLLDIDYASYRMVQHPQEFDVIVAPNLFGDILSDLGGILLGTRALTYGGNFGPNGEAFYQTNHGAAYDLAGRDVANPAGQILSMAMLLGEGFGLHQAADRMRRALQMAWGDGWRTADVAEEGCRVVGTRQFVEQVLAAVEAPRMDLVAGTK